jgi:murein DD-endopeptidase MepM/ murein hydrolase activator NlpD
VAGNNVQPRLARMHLTVAAVVLCLGLVIATPALAGTGGAPTAAGSPPSPGSATGAPTTDAPSAGALTLTAASASPRKSFYYGYRYPRLSFTIASDQATNDLRVDIVDEAGASVRTYFRNDVVPGTETKIRWDGAGNDGKPAPNGRYTFSVSSQAGEVATRPARRATASEGSLDLGFDFYGYAFPILGDHEYSLSAGRFGAGRSGHTHQGQDIMAACGTPLVAARGGRVQMSTWDDAAGNYLVIDGKGPGNDFMYAHLAEPSLLQEGDTVRTGQPIGIVGDTGDAQGCHLHFEIWSAPGWYEGGSPFDPLPLLQKWDAYS